MAATIRAASATAASASVSLLPSGRPASRVAASAQLTPAKLSQPASLSLAAATDSSAARLPRRSTVVRAAEAAEASEAAADSLADDGSGLLGDSVEGKHRLVLKFVWLDKNIGIAVDQVVPGKGTVPLSPYMFWPRKDAWEELKNVLESKPWLPKRRMIILLNQATDIINLWQSQAYKQT